MSPAIASRFDFTGAQETRKENKIRKYKVLVNEQFMDDSFKNCGKGAKFHLTILLSRTGKWIRINIYRYLARDNIAGALSVALLHSFEEYLLDRQLVQKKDKKRVSRLQADPF